VDRGRRRPGRVPGRAAGTGTSCTRLLAEYQPEFLEDNGITPENLGRLIAAKIGPQSILYEGGRRIVHIIGEAVLRTRVGNVTFETMRASLPTSATSPRYPAMNWASSSSPSHRPSRSPPDP
jgi:hypothetical protein